MTKVAYMNGLEEYAQELSAFGFEIIPYKQLCGADAVIYNQAHSISQIHTSTPVFLLNVSALKPGESAEALERKTYSPMF